MESKAVRNLLHFTFVTSLSTTVGANWVIKWCWISTKTTRIDFADIKKITLFVMQQSSLYKELLDFPPTQ